MTDKLTEMLKADPNKIAGYLESAYLEPLLDGSKRSPQQVIADLKANRATLWNDAYRQSGDVAMTIKMGLRWKRHPAQSVEAFLVSFADVKDFSTSPPATVGIRPIIMLADGRQLDENSTPKNSLVQGVNQPGTRLVISNVDVDEDIYGIDGFRVRVGPTSQADVKPHDAPFPAISSDAVLERCFAPAKGKAGVTGGIAMETAFDLAFFTGTVGRQEEVRYYAPGKYPNESLQAMVRDPNNKVWKVQLDAADVRRQFFLDNNATDQDYKFALNGEPVLLLGKASVAKRVQINKLPNAKKILDEINQEVLEGRAVTYKNDKKVGAVLGLVMHRQKDGPSGSVPADTHLLGGLEFYQVRQEAVKNDKGSHEIGWVGYQPLQILDEPFEFEAKTKPWENNEGSGVMNAGARAVFLSRLGDQKLPADDPFAQFAAKAGQ